MGNKANKTAKESPPQTKLKRDEAIPATNAKEAIERKGYVIIANIGEGGFGKVYKVREKETNEEFAIKETPFLGENGYDQTMREVANGCILNHPNVIKFFEYFINRGTNKLYITMELCEYNLRKWFKQNTKNRSYTEAIRMIRQITAGIEYVHGKNIMHRDLKPENILITNNGQTCKIVDFGLSTVHISKHSFGKGSLLYVSPEQFTQESYDFKTDVFPLGLIVMEFFTVFDTEKQWVDAIINIQRYHQLPKQFFERHKLTFPKKYIEAQNLVMAMTKVCPDQRPTVTEVIKHPFFAFGNNVNVPKPGPSQPEKNDLDSNDRNELRGFIQRLLLLNLLEDNNDDVNNTDKDIVESDEDVNNTDKDVESDEDVNQTINKTLREIMTQRESNNEREIPESGMLNGIIKQLTYQRIKQKQMHCENINNDEKNRVLCEIISQGQKRRQKILDDIEEKNRMILDITARREIQSNLLRDEMQEDLRVILDIIMDGDSSRGADISFKKTLNDMLKIILKVFMSLKKIQDLEKLNRKITELMSENQFHRSIYDTMGTKILTLITGIPAESKADDLSENYKSSVNATDPTIEEITLSACERHTDNVQLLGRSLTALYYILKNGKNKFQNINRALDFVLRVMIQYSKDTNILIPATASLSHIVRSEASKHHSDIEVKKKIITQILDVMHLHQDDVKILTNCIKTLLLFEIPDDVVFESSRLIQIMLYNVTKHDDYAILVGSLCILMSLSHAKEMKKMMGDSGAIEKLLAVINSQFQRKICDEVMVTAWSIMWNITDENEFTCEQFLVNDGMRYFISCMNSFPENIQLHNSMMGVIANLAECKSLRQKIMEPEYLKIFIKLLDHHESDNIELSISAAGILSHIASEGIQLWNQFLSFDCSLKRMLTQLRAAVSRWKINSKRNVNYNSLKPFMRLLRCDQSPPEAQYWAVWELANLTRVNCSRYCPMLAEDNGTETLELLISNPDTQPYVLQLARLTLVQYHIYVKDGNLGGMENSDQINGIDGFKE